MNSSLPFIVIADPEPARKMHVVGILGAEHEATFQEVDGWDTLVRAISEAVMTRKNLKAVFLAEGLPQLLRLPLDAQITALRGFAIPHVVVLVDNAAVGVEETDGIHILAPDRIGGELSKQKILDVLAKCNLRAFPALPRLKVLPESDLILHEQLQALEVGSPEESSNDNLKRMIRDMWWDRCEEATVEKLSQGYSGSAAFRISFKLNQRDVTFVMKISPGSDLLKIQNWASQWKGGINPMLEQGDGLKWYRPSPVSPSRRCSCSEFHVSAGGLFGEAWQFLGKQVETVVDLQKAFEEEGRSPGDAGLAERLVAGHIAVLRKLWYRPNPGAGTVEGRLLWDGKHAQSLKPLCFPPYRLTAGRKAHILRFLEKFDRIGTKLLPDVWLGSTGKIKHWLQGGPGKMAVINLDRNVVLSPIHGDLNRNNMLWWKEENQPLLIDFVNFQAKGHTLHDFASLEAEVKFALMDTEDLSPLEAFDYSPSRLQAWCKAEDILLDETAPKQASGHERQWEPSKGIERGMAMVRSIRSEALSTHSAILQNAGGRQEDSDFSMEYLAALLYSTLRTIGYDMHSPFKRLLAVYSAGKIIDCFGDEP